MNFFIQFVYQALVWKGVVVTKRHPSSTHLPRLRQLQIISTLSSYLVSSANLKLKPLISKAFFQESICKLVLIEWCFTASDVWLRKVCSGHKGFVSIDTALIPPYSSKTSAEITMLTINDFFRSNSENCYNASSSLWRRYLQSEW